MLKLLNGKKKILLEPNIEIVVVRSITTVVLIIV